MVNQLTGFYCIVLHSLAVQIDAGSCPVLKLSPQANARFQPGRAQHFFESKYDLTWNSNLTDGTKASFLKMCSNNSNKSIILILRTHFCPLHWSHKVPVAIRPYSEGSLRNDFNIFF